MVPGAQSVLCRAGQITQAPAQIEGTILEFIFSIETVS